MAKRCSLWGGKTLNNICGGWPLINVLSATFNGKWSYFNNKPDRCRAKWLDQSRLKLELEVIWCVLPFLCSSGEVEADWRLHWAGDWSRSDSPSGAHLQRNAASTQPPQNESPLSGEQQHRHQLPENQGDWPVHGALINWWWWWESFRH